MALSATAQRMLGSLPSYYWGNPLVERVIQAWANEIDRIDARLDQIKDGLVPSLADDTLGMLALWEATLNLPINPPDATITQRRTAVNAALRKLDASSAAAYIVVLSAALRTGAWQLVRDFPDMLHDRLDIPFAPGSYTSVQAEEIARRMHPAHRALDATYVAGFLLDLGRLDDDLMR